MAWGSPISARRASRRSNCRSGQNRSPRSSASARGSGEPQKKEVAGQGVAAATIKVIVRAHIRYAGTDTALVVKAGSLAAMKRAFEAAHKARFGFIDRSKQIVVEAVSVEAVGGGANFKERRHGGTEHTRPPHQMTRFFSQGRWHDAGVYLRNKDDGTPGLDPGCRIDRKS